MIRRPTIAKLRPTAKASMLVASASITSRLMKKWSF
jgi:hypothetical protein